MMARVKFVKKARKDNPVVKAGESYYWWAFRYGGKHFSKTRPKSSQLTQSPFYSEWRAIEEDFDEVLIDSPDDLQSFIADAAERLHGLAYDAEESLSNMPQGLQEGETGQTLQNRYDEAEGWANALEEIDCEFSQERDDFETDEEYDEAIESFIDEKRSEAQDISPGEPE